MGTCAEIALGGPKPLSWYVGAEAWDALESIPQDEDGFLTDDGHLVEDAANDAVQKVSKIGTSEAFDTFRKFVSQRMAGSRAGMAEVFKLAADRTFRALAPVVHAPRRAPSSGRPRGRRVLAGSGSRGDPPLDESDPDLAGGAR